MFGFGSKQLTGLDIGASSIKVAEILQSSKGAELKSFGMVPLPPEVIVDGAIMDAEIVKDAIKQVFKEARIRNKNVAISVSGHSVIVKKIIVPEMTQQDLEKSIETEARQYIPFDIEDVNVDFQILERAPMAQQGEMEVLLVAVKKDKINEQISLVRESGLNPAVIDIDSFAFENIYELNYEAEPGSVALIDLGASTMKINIMQDGTSTFVRDISMGGNQYTEALQKEFNVNFETAEKMKRGQMLEGIPQDSVLSVVNAISEDIVVEVQRSFDFFRASAPDVNINKVVLGGGSSLFGDIDRFFADKLGINVERVNPFRNIKVNQKRFDMEYMESIAPRASVVMGLGLRRLDDKWSK
jgi:type IV pilus assembly protein PilM